MRAETTIEADEPDDLVGQLLATTNDPARFVELAFPAITPEGWQLEVLQSIGNQLQEECAAGSVEGGADRNGKREWSGQISVAELDHSVGLGHVRRDAGCGDGRDRAADQDEAVGRAE